MTTPEDPPHERPGPARRLSAAVRGGSAGAAVGALVFVAVAWVMVGADWLRGGAPRDLGAAEAVGVFAFATVWGLVAGLMVGAPAGAVLGATLGAFRPRRDRPPPPAS